MVAHRIRSRFRIPCATSTTGSWDVLTVPQVFYTVLPALHSVFIHWTGGDNLFPIACLQDVTLISKDLKVTQRRLPENSRVIRKKL